MFYIRLKNNKVDEILTEKQKEMFIFDKDDVFVEVNEVDGIKNGMVFENGSFVEDIDILVEQIDQETSAKIFSKYSDNKQRTLTMRAMMGDRTEFEEMTSYVNQCLAEGQAKKDALLKK